MSEIEVSGTWRDPGGASSDERATNDVMAIEDGEIAHEAVGNSIAACRRIVKDLEVNEVILYNRTTNVESGSLRPRGRRHDGRRGRYDDGKWFSASA